MRKIVFILTLLFLHLLPKPVFAAAVCVCYFGEKDDCTPVTVKDSALEGECEATCKKTYGDDFTAHEYADTAFSGASVEVSCTIAHATAVTTKTKESKVAIVTPKLSVQIPGLTFSPVKKISGNLHINFLADYLNSTYKYLINISVFIAIALVMFAGIRYVLAAGSGDIKKAQTQIKNAVVGVVLLLSTYLILFIVNPELVRLKSVVITEVERIEGVGNNEVTDETDEATTYPDVSVTPGSLPKFKQCDAKWKKHAYKGPDGKTVSCGPNKHNKEIHEDNVCESGCGPTSVAAVLVYNGINVTPPAVADVAAKVGAHLSCSSGTSLGILCKEIPKSWPGQGCKSISPKNTSLISKILGQKKPIVFSCHGCTGKLADGSDKSYKGHYMVLTGISGDFFEVYDVGRMNGIVKIPKSEFENGKIPSAYLIEKK
ncbi:C39 family peptidase [Candidatus Uhrbacteria bacterium]|nr:C39 family peptidase [Candidatus Uhrbacteria bacterium]